MFVVSNLQYTAKLLKINNSTMMNTLMYYSVLIFVVLSHVSPFVLFVEEVPVAKWLTCWTATS